ncbi:MAG: hypothetical protein EP330_27000 [Deltaproteobacteria bacterium]|nr:MAG: hypothetical protein EP330_27000 [Deltaproteobacteria bacterium]
MSTHARAVGSAMDDGAIPRWLSAMTALLIVSNLAVFGGYAFLDPHAVFPGLNEAGEYPARFFAIRHLAFVPPLVHGLIHQDRAILGTMYRIFLVIAVLDVASVLFYGWPYPFVGPLPLAVNALIGTLVFLLPMTAGVIALSRR